MTRVSFLVCFNFPHVYRAQALCTPHSFSLNCWRSSQLTGDLQTLYINKECIKDHWKRSRPDGRENQWTQRQKSRNYPRGRRELNLKRWKNSTRNIWIHQEEQPKDNRYTRRRRGGEGNTQPTQIIDGNFPSLWKEHKFRTKEANRTPKYINAKSPSPRQDFIQTSKGKTTVSQKGNPIRLSSDFSVETLHDRKEQKEILKYWTTRISC